MNIKIYYTSILYFSIKGVMCTLHSSWGSNLSFRFRNCAALHISGRPNASNTISMAGLSVFRCLHLSVNASVKQSLTLVQFQQQRVWPNQPGLNSRSPPRAPPRVPGAGTYVLRFLRLANVQSQKKKTICRSYRVRNTTATKSHLRTDEFLRKG